MNPDPQFSWLAEFWADLDPMTPAGSAAHSFWAVVSVLAFVLFSGRFYLQWIVSELRGKSVVPVAFWYMSAIGALLFLAFNTHAHSPVGTLSYSFNIVVYARNLVHIWSERVVFSRAMKWTVNGLVAVVALIGAACVVYTWLHPYHPPHTESATRAWFWIAIGAAGTGLFACRFAVQWLASEAKKKSVVPVSFWYISVAAAILQSASYGQRQEWMNLTAVAVNLPIYLRNLWLIHRGKATASASE